MKFVYLILFVPYALLLASENYPQIFQQQGTPLFEAVHKFEKLQQVPVLSKAVVSYNKKANNVLKLGEEADDAVEKKKKIAYLKALRSLQKSYNKTIDLTKKYLTNVMERNDTVMFLTLVDSDLDFGNSSLNEKMLLFYREHGNLIHSEYMEKRILDQKRLEASAGTMYAVETVSPERKCNLAFLQHNLNRIINKPAAFYALVLVSGEDDWLRINSRYYSIIEDTKNTVGCKYYEATGTTRYFLYPLHKPFSIDAHLTRLEKEKFAALTILTPNVADEYRKITAFEDMKMYNQQFTEIMQSHSRMVYAGVETNPHVESTDTRLSGR